MRSTLRTLALVALIVAVGLFGGAYALARVIHGGTRHAEAAAAKAREDAAFERGKLEAMCLTYCSDPELTWTTLAEPSIDRMEGHVFSINGEPDLCHCVLVDFPPRRDAEP